MTHNPIGDIVDEAVNTLTELAELTEETSTQEGTEVSFPERVGDILTHVAANVHGVDHLTAHSRHDQAQLVRQFVDLTTDHQDLISWRTTPIIVPPEDIRDLYPEEAARSVDDSDFAQYQRHLLVAMNTCASELGYNALVQVATPCAPTDPADAQLVEYLHTSAVASTSRPAPRP